jgi:hypothetical protein
MPPKKNRAQFFSGGEPRKAGDNLLLSFARWKLLYDLLSSSAGLQAYARDTVNAGGVYHNHALL